MDDMDADQIRSKRLAKLASQTTGSPSSPQTEPQSSSKPASPPPAPQQQHPQPSSSSETPPASNKPSEIKRIRITQTGNQGSSAKAPYRPPETIEEFENRTLCNIFRLSLQEDRRTDIHGQKLTYLNGVRQDLEDEGAPIRMSVTILDQALLEAASRADDQKPLSYLLPCWKRISTLSKGFKKPAVGEPKYDIILEARRLCIGYCIFAATMPEMFGVESPPSAPLKPHLLLDPDEDQGLNQEFIQEALKRAEEDDTIIPAFVTAVEEMSKDLSRLTLDDDYQPYMMALRNLVRYPAIATAITESPKFMPVTLASHFEILTLLGPWFALSPLHPNVTLKYFSSPKTRDQHFILNAQRSMRMTQQLVQSELLDIVNFLIRASKSARENVLDWFAASLNANHKRRALNVDPKQVSSDGFMFNITTCLDQLCEPFMDATFTKIDRIELEYLKRNPRVQMRDETKLNADQETSDAFYNKTVEGQSNFITEIFFLTVAAHHYGSESLTSKLNGLHKHIRDMQSHIDRFELERPRWASNPPQLRMFEEALKKYKDRLELGMALEYALQGLLLDELWQSRSMQFMRYVIVWLLRLISGRNFPKESIQLPLPDQQSEGLKCLPEYFLDDIISNFKFVLLNMPQIVTSTQGDELMILCITLLQSTNYIKNPSMKSGLITILYYGTLSRRRGGRGVLVDMFNSMPFALNHLLHSLMMFYIEAEFTGTHTQFSDKFSIRYEIFQIIKCIWPNQVYREKLSVEAKKNLDFFVQFVNLLLNDVTYILDLSFTSFIKIHDTQEELNREGSSMDENARQEKEEFLDGEKRRAKATMQLTNETVAMLKLFTEALADSFTMKEIVQRLADMINYNLDAMVGPKSANLRVDNPAEYGFNPRNMLNEITDVYLNLMDKESFILAVARDGRSYKPANFKKAAEILQKFALKSPEDLAKWDRLQDAVKAAKEEDEQAEEDLGEIPDEFLDPLMYTLMEDPVILPSSKVSIDRSTIRSHLLSDPNDPFNRAPLKIEEVVPDIELREKIEAFRAEKRAAKMNATQTEGSDKMETGPG
ncbi:Ubiquitin conjugation factor E4 [Microsporum audouinii]